VKRPLAIAKQAASPSGFWGRLLLRVMARETTRFNNEILSMLGIEDTDRVLEVGFGHGRTLATAAAHTRATFAGVDISADALRVASRRCRGAIADGRMDLRVGDAAALPWEASSFSKAFTVHTIYFWTEPMSCLRELRRVVQPGGRLVVGFRERSDEALAAFPASIYRLYSADEVLALLRDAGFSAELRRSESAPHLWAAIGA
jgi:ubiquinone/menaquinone biosynthesis C-methylase UbiE